MRRELLKTLAATTAVGFAVVAAMLWVSDGGVPTWLLYATTITIGLLWPVRHLQRQPASCGRCLDGRHIHDVNSGQCITKTCDCKEAS